MLLFQPDDKKFLSATLVSFAAALLLVASPLFAQTTTPPTVPHAQGVDEANGNNNDFDNDIRINAQKYPTSSVEQIQQAELRSEEYKSVWDEFGINTLVDGVLSPATISKEIVRDITHTVQTEMNYDQQEADYLEAVHSTPEEIQAVEGPSGSDVPSNEPINPNPSVEANPDVSAFSVEGLDQNSIDTSGAVQEGGAGNVQEPPPAGEVVPEATVPSAATENAIFEAILQGEEAAPPQEAPAEAPPAE